MINKSNYIKITNFWSKDFIKKIQKARHKLGEGIYNDTTGGVEYRIYKEFL